jgi:hypothetical protein
MNREQMRKTEEEKVANVIAKIVADLRLDLDLIGFYLAVTLPSVSFRRLKEIVEAADEQNNVGR